MLRFLVIALLVVSCCGAQEAKPAPTIPELTTSANEAYRKADYEGARQILLKAWDLAQQLPDADPLRYDVLKRLTTVRSAAGDFSDADNYLQMAISWREQNASPGDPKTIDDILLSVGFARQRKAYEQALAIMSRVLRLHTAANREAGLPEPGVSITVADDFSRVAQIQAELQKLDQAIESLKIAVSIRSKVVGQFDPSLVYDLDRLAGLQITTRAYTDAEQTYRYALVIRETIYGQSNADLISTVDGLAYSLFGQKRYDDAEPVYQRLLALWIDSVKSETHPMVAIACDKLAVFYGEQKKWDRVREYRTRANAIRAFILAESYSVDASERIDEGKLTDAVGPYGRALKVLDEPNPIYDELRHTIEALSQEIEKLVKKPTYSPAPPRKK